MIANYCRSCSTDFASLTAFDAHRVGKHAYTLTQGLKLDPPREDGRGCLALDELPEAGLELDGHDRWRIRLTEATRERLAGLAEARQDVEESDLTPSQPPHDSQAIPAPLAAPTVREDSVSGAGLAPDRSVEEAV